MLFNSIDFAIFLPVVFGLYWFVLNKNLKVQNLLIVVASYVFYGSWDWRFLFLIVLSTGIDYSIGIALAEEDRKGRRKLLLWCSLLANLGILGFFKYYNFFIDNFITAFTFFGSRPDVRMLDIILPVGISFYTFQTLSYTLDVYQHKMTPTRDFVAFSAFVSFFPQLVAGPIEKASHLLPQFYKKRTFDYAFAVSGARIIVWGLFKKMVVADNAAIIVDGIFTNYEAQSSLALVLGAVLFAFQIYCDFSGYSDIAIGTGRLFGFDLMTNFLFPYLSPNISEFWKRWHISLSTWFRDYVYIPLGGSRISQAVALRNIAVVFLVSGFWHGANWTFIVWGGIHAMLYIPVFMKRKASTTLATTPHMAATLGKTLINFIIVTLAWVYFRSDSVGMANDYLIRMFSGGGKAAYFLISSKYMLITAISFGSILLLLAVETYAFRRQQKEVLLDSRLLLGLCLMILFVGALKNHANFIYFQF
ncbi:MBOAT family protein [Roseivirga sp. BDSF3-8]|uniref:MBOAT family O-acyltransferase n=1 Tax=Roseivirga sp. BDSF3-8 TaxID=3241598 RepID=UPI00353232D8